MVHDVWRGDVDDVDIGILNQSPPVSGAFLETISGGGIGSHFIARIGEHIEMGDGRQITIQHASTTVGVRMGLAHEA